MKIKTEEIRTIFFHLKFSVAMQYQKFSFYFFSYHFTYFWLYMYYIVYNFISLAGMQWEKSLNYMKLIPDISRKLDHWPYVMLISTEYRQYRKFFATNGLELLLVRFFGIKNR